MKKQKSSKKEVINDVWRAYLYDAGIDNYVRKLFKEDNLTKSEIKSRISKEYNFPKNLLKKEIKRIVNGNTKKLRPKDKAN